MVSGVASAPETAGAGLAIAIKGGIALKKGIKKLDCAWDFGKKTSHSYRQYRLDKETFEDLEGAGNTWNKKVLEQMKDPNYKIYQVDCSEIAEQLYKVAGEQGKIYRIVGKGEGGWIKGYEYGRIEDYLYHEVYSDGKYIYDPRYSEISV